MQIITHHFPHENGDEYAHVLCKCGTRFYVSDFEQESAECPRCHAVRNLVSMIMEHEDARTLEKSHRARLQNRFERVQ